MNLLILYLYKMTLMMRYTVLIFFLLAFVSCGEHKETENAQSESFCLTTYLDEQESLRISKLKPTLLKDTTLTILFDQKYPIATTVRIPTSSQFKGTIITLPGWNFSRNQWCDSTELCSKALEQGYILIQPEMGKSIYCDSLFPETRGDWKRYPTRQWINDSLIPQLQSHNLLLAEHSNFLIGLSTGARGAALIALDHPTLFSGCAVLSGDYDQTQYPKDNLYRGYYGSYSLYPKRWKTNDNLITSLEDLKVPIYIGHGKKDQIVPVEHSEHLKKSLDSIGNTNYEFHLDETAKHNYTYWNSEVENVLSYFTRLVSSSPTSN